MISFFRKLRRSFVSQNRFTKYALYAIGEIILIVFGILIALYVNNINENRRVYKAEKILLESLFNEMEENKKELVVSMDYHKKSFSAAKEILIYYSEPDKYPPAQEIDSLLALAQWAWTYDPSMGVVDAIKSSGFLNEVRNKDLRSLISRYEDVINDTKEESRLIQDLIVNNYVPLVNKYIPIHQRAKYLGEEYVAVPKSTFVPDYNKLFSDRELESLLGYIYTWRMDELKEEMQLLKMMDQFLNQINEELNY